MRKVNKSALVLGIIISFVCVSCNFKRNLNLELELKNQSNSEITRIEFVTELDTLKIERLEKGASFSKSLKYITPKNSTDAAGGWRIKFTQNGKEKNMGCYDIDNHNSNKKLKLSFKNNDIDMDFQGGECY